MANLKDYMYKRAAMSLAGEPPKKLQKSEIPNPTRDEMKSREYANSKSSSDENPLETSIKQNMKNEFQNKDKDMRTSLEKAMLERKVSNYEKRESKMGGSKAVTGKIKRREYLRKNAKDIKTGAAVVVGGTAALIKSLKDAVN